MSIEINYTNCINASFVGKHVFQNRTINHQKGSHGVPGIFVKYDLNPLKVFVKEESRSYLQFLVRLCGIVGGIFATSGRQNCNKCPV